MVFAQEARVGMKKGMCTWTWHQARILTLLVPFLWWGSNASPSLTSQEASSDASIETMRADLLIVVGSAGEASYRDLFSEWAETLRTVADKAKVNVITLGPDTPSEGDGSLRKQVQSSLNELSRSAQAPLWLVFIGHGTFNGRTANFNLAGPDISSKDLAAWLSPMKRPLAIMNTTSASAPFLSDLSGPNRVVLTATRDGYELNFTRFGAYLFRALANPSADLDKDGQTSLLEAFIMASSQVGDFYELEGRLASEHALLDDTGDQKGISADWFKGLRPVKKAKGSMVPDGRVASQFHLVESAMERSMSPEMKRRRDAMERSVFELRDRRETMDESSYFEKLEALLVPIAELYAQIKEDSPAPGSEIGSALKDSE
jgi:hypothetical protein